MTGTMRRVYIALRHRSRTIAGAQRHSVNALLIKRHQTASINNTINQQRIQTGRTYLLSLHRHLRRLKRGSLCTLGM